MERMKWFLAVSTTIGVFAIVALLFYKEIPNAVENVLFTAVGIIIGKWGTIVDFNFGSSSGSLRKTDMLQELTGTGDGNGGTVKTNVTTKTDITKTTTSETPPDTKEP